MQQDLKDIYNRLYAYCQAVDFVGHDPFDGLNSSLFRATPLGRLRVARLAWLQTIKRSPVDLRGLLHVSAGANPKGLALFALAEMSRFRVTERAEHADNAKALIERMLERRIDGETPHGEPTTAFGYNFDWQSRHFFAPVGTPAIVPTAFAAHALHEGWELFADDRWLEAARGICRFILSDLNRPVETGLRAETRPLGSVPSLEEARSFTLAFPPESPGLFETDDELCFSYTPLDNEIVYNASLLAGETLARVGAATGDEEYLQAAAKTARFVIARQRPDGAWAYGAGPKQGWVDNFHTGYVLLSLKRISDFGAAIKPEADMTIARGIEYWLDNFFLDDGTPRYFDNATYPVDIHAAAVAIAALSELHRFDVRLLPMARKTAEWTIANMFDSTGFFYYQIRRRRTSKTPFMRWGQAWMAYGLARLMEVTQEAEK